MSRIILHRVRFVLIACIALLALPAAALAAPPTFRDKLDITFDDVEICGISGTSHVTGVQIVREGDGYIKVTGQVTETFTATDGRTVRFHFANLFEETFTDNGDGTGTYVTTWKGLPESISGAQGGPVTRDAGVATLTTHWDEVNDVLIWQEWTIVHGPHPELDSGFSIFCDAFHEALGS